MTRPLSRRGRPCRAGFLRLELLLGLVVAALAGWLVLEVGGRVRQRARAAALGADLREFAGVFARHARPAATGRTGLRLSPALEHELRATRWYSGSPYGGTYEWLPAARGAGPARGPRTGFGGAIAVTAYAPQFPLALSPGEFRALDAQIDDGDPATGRLRAGFNGWPVYLLEEAR